jgi:hypothetical protein
MPHLFYILCRQKLQARIKELEKAKKAFIEEERRKRDAAAKEGSKEAKVGGLCLLAWSFYERPRTGAAGAVVECG